MISFFIVAFSSSAGLDRLPYSRKGRLSALCTFVYYYSAPSTYSEVVMRTSSLRFINRQTVNMASETIWSFGYGSNMDVVALEAKKKVKVLGKLFYILHYCCNYLPN